MNPDDSDDTNNVTAPPAPADDTNTDADTSAAAPVIEPDVDDNADTVPAAAPDPNVATPATSTPDESVPTVPSDPAILSASQISPSSLAAPQSANTAFLDAIRPLAVAADHRRTAKQEDQLIAFAVQHGSITRADARRLLEISRTTIDRCFDDLVRQGKLIKTGPKSETVYKIP
jgi:uncharacterized membrane protein